MNPICLLSNLTWAALSRRKWYRFQKAAEVVENVQAAYLLKLLRKNRDTTYGRRYDFGRIGSVKDYQQRVPITEYEDYVAYVQRIRQGRSNVLTAARVKLLEPTSGTTSASKLIPYTDCLKAEFQNGIGAWIYNLFTSYPGLLGGKAYWAITPNIQPGRDKDDYLPIGFSEDGEYFGALEKRLIEQIMVGPAALSTLPDMQTCRYVTGLFLFSEPNLRMLSVWNPTYLELLLKDLDSWAERIVEDIRQGDIHPPTPIPGPIMRLLRRNIKKNPGRARLLKEVIEQWRRDDQFHPWSAIWPDLKLISCWADGWAGQSIPGIKALFPQAVIQPKGLLATEAIVTFPLEGLESRQLRHVLAVTSHFYEFEELVTLKVRLAHELEAGKEYAVIVTTGGGLYRYRLKDRVRVEGAFRQAPLLRFIGKTGGVSDLFGEKLHEDHLRRSLDGVFTDHACQPEFYFVAPQAYRNGYCYTLFLETPDTDVDDTLIEGEIERKLRHNFHYDYCRRLGQLGALKVYRLPQGARHAYFESKSRLSKSGTVKYALLEKQSDWVERLAGVVSHAE